MNTNSPKLTTVPKEPARVRSEFSFGTNSPPIDSDDTAGVGGVYLDVFNVPALASSTDAYMQTYEVVRAILEGKSVPAAQVAAQAAHDAAASHIERRLAGGGADE